MKITTTLLPATVTTPRDILYCTQKEAEWVARDIGAHAVINDPDGAGILIKEVSALEIGGMPNVHPEDGRKAFELIFTKDMVYTDPSTNRARVITIPFKINAGQALQLLEDNPTLAWEFGTQGEGTELSGTLEKLN